VKAAVCLLASLLAGGGWANVCTQLPRMRATSPLLVVAPLAVALAAAAAAAEGSCMTTTLPCGSAATSLQPSGVKASRCAGAEQSSGRVTRRATELSVELPLLLLLLLLLALLLLLLLLVLCDSANTLVPAVVDTAA
jgi:hypothetical protein